MDNNREIEILLKHSIDSRPITMIRQVMCTAYHQGKAAERVGCKSIECETCPLSSVNEKAFEKTFIKMYNKVLNHAK